MKIPAGVGFHTIQASSLDFGQNVLPVLGQRPEIMESTALNFEFFTIEPEFFILDG
jgi:hypothetical protein